MLRKSTLLLAIAYPCLLLLLVPSQSQGNEEIRAVRMRKLMMAYELAEQARMDEAPEFLIAAAGMLRELSRYEDLQYFRTIDFEQTIEIGRKQIPAVKFESSNENSKGPGAASLLQQSNDWFLEASDMGAALNINVDKLIKRAKDRAAEAEQKAVFGRCDRVGGPRQITRKLTPGQTDTYTIQLVSGVPRPWLFNSVQPLDVSVRTIDSKQPHLRRSTQHAADVWYPDPKQEVVAIVVQIKNLSKVLVEYQFMRQ